VTCIFLKHFLAHFFWMPSHCMNIDEHVPWQKPRLADEDGIIMVPAFGVFLWGYLTATCLHVENR
jgi:hypothetical protein